MLLLALYVSAQSPKTKVARAKAKAAAPVSYGNSDAISELELKIYDYFLASDQLEGRNLPSRGFDTAALYVASHLAEWGLKPMGSTEKTNGPLQPYFMPFELATRSVVADESKISLTAPGRRTWRAGRRRVSWRTYTASASGRRGDSSGCGRTRRAWRPRRRTRRRGAHHRVRVRQGLDHGWRWDAAEHRPLPSKFPATSHSWATVTSSIRRKPIHSKASM